MLLDSKTKTTIHDQQDFRLIFVVVFCFQVCTAPARTEFGMCCKWVLQLLKVYCGIMNAQLTNWNWAPCWVVNNYHSDPSVVVWFWLFVDVASFSFLVQEKSLKIKRKNQAHSNNKVASISVESKVCFGRTWRKFSVSLHPTNWSSPSLCSLSRLFVCDWVWLVIVLLRCWKKMNLDKSSLSCNFMCDNQRSLNAKTHCNKSNNNKSKHNKSKQQQSKQQQSKQQGSKQQAMLCLTWVKFNVTTNSIKWTCIWNCFWRLCITFAVGFFSIWKVKYVGLKTLICCKMKTRNNEDFCALWTASSFFFWALLIVMSLHCLVTTDEGQWQTLESLDSLQRVMKCPFLDHSQFWRTSVHQQPNSANCAAKAQQQTQCLKNESRLVQKMASLLTCPAIVESKFFWENSKIKWEKESDPPNKKQEQLWVSLKTWFLLETLHSKSPKTQKTQLVSKSRFEQTHEPLKLTDCQRAQRTQFRDNFWHFGVEFGSYDCSVAWYLLWMTPE